MPTRQDGIENRDKVYMCCEGGDRLFTVELRLWQMANIKWELLKQLRPKQLFFCSHETGMKGLFWTGSKDK